MLFNFPLLKDVGDIRGKRVFLAIDLNVAIQDGRVLEPYRIERSRKTLDFLMDNGARTLLVSHRTEEDATLKPVFEYLKTFYSVVFAKTLKEAGVLMEKAAAGSFVMLENIRKIAGAKEKSNDRIFSKDLASLADIYINEAFSISHREHASIVGVPKFLPSYAGFLFAEEISHLSQSFNPPRPFVFILAGAKFETKSPLAEKFLKSADSVFIGGALSNDLFKTKGYEIGLSKYSDADLGFAGLLMSPKLVLPTDVVVENAGKSIVKKPTEVLTNDNILDAGPRTIALLSEQISTAKFVLWNGTLGVCEKGFTEGTESLAKVIAKSSAESIVGGGDTLAAIGKLNLNDKFSFVSTGGGAMLEFLAKGTLPGIEALQQAVSN